MMEQCREKGMAGGARPGSVKEVIHLAWPIVVSMLSYTAMGVTDTLFVGWVGKSALGAVGLATMAIFLVNGFFLGVLESVRVVSAQAAGARDGEAARSAAWQGVILAVPSGCVVIGLGLLHGGLFPWLGATPEVCVLAGDYFKIRVLASPFWYVTMALCNAMQGAGDTRTPMKVSLLANALNIVLDPLLIFGPGPFPALGVEGAAWATVAACAAGMFHALAAWLGRFGFHPRFDGRVLRAMVRLGLPIGIRYVLEIGGWTLFTALLARMGDDELAANQVAINIIKVSFLPGYAVSAAACILTGKYLGAGDLGNVHRSYRSALMVAVGFMAALGLVFCALPGLLVGCFQDDPAVLAIGRRLLWVAACFQIFDAVAMVTVGALNGVGDTRYTMVVSILATWLVLVPCTYVLGVRAGLGALGGWLGITLDVVVMAVFFTRRFNREGWRDLGLAVPQKSGTQKSGTQTDFENQGR